MVPLSVGLGSECASYRVETLQPTAVRVRDPGGRTVRQQADGTAGESAASRGVGHQPGSVRGRRRSAASATNAALGCRKFR